jgi:CheY-like chemotaxis protein
MATGYPTRDNHDECMKLGAVAYLTKPVEIPELKALLEWIDRNLPEGSEQ